MAASSKPTHFPQICDRGVLPFLQYVFLLQVTDLLPGLSNIDCRPAVQGGRMYSITPEHLPWRDLVLALLFLDCRSGRLSGHTLNERQAVRFSPAGDVIPSFDYGRRRIRAKAERDDKATALGKKGAGKLRLRVQIGSGNRKHVRIGIKNSPACLFDPGPAPCTAARSLHSAPERRGKADSTAGHRCRVSKRLRGDYREPRFLWFRPSA